MGRYQSGQMGQTVNLLALAFAGSNPARPTKFMLINPNKIGRSFIKIFLILFLVLGLIIIGLMYL
jgi:hypothetical protein